MFKKFKSYWPHQEVALDFIKESDKKIICLNSPTGCHPKGQDILMYDGTIKKVEDIKVNDKLMGPDGLPRIVESLIQGYGKIYQIRPIKGKPFLVNENHILTLKKTSDYTIKDVPLKKYLQWSRTQKHLWKLFKVSIDFKSSILMTGFTVEEKGMDDFFGFTLQGDGRYLLDDFTVTHNSGKSLIGMSIGLLFNTPIVYLCSSKSLQNQIIKDFPEAVLLKGRSNYPCNRFEDDFPIITAEDCVMEDCPSIYRNSCYYRIQKKEVLSSQYAILNYHYFLYEANYIGNFSERSWIIADEGDMAESILSNFISLRFPNKLLEIYGFPKRKTKHYAFHEWLLDTIPRLEKDMEFFYSTYLQTKNIEYMKRYLYTKSFYDKLNFICTELDTNWVLNVNNSLELKPIWIPPNLVNKFFLNHSKRWLFMSATLPTEPVFCGLLGIDRQNVDYLELPHTFPVENRLIFYHPSVNLTHDTFSDKLVRELALSIKDILNKHKGRGIIHTVSYKLANALIEYLPDRVISHTTKTKEKALDMYYNTPHAVLISPSIERGLDLHDDLAEFAIWCKAPFKNLADRYIRARVYGSGKWGKLWYKADTVNTIIQGAGRICRHKKDIGYTYLLDEQIGRLLKDTKLWPLWFRQALVYN